MNTTNHTSPIGDDAANVAIGEREAFERLKDWPTMPPREVFYAGYRAASQQSPKGDEPCSTDALFARVTDWMNEHHIAFEAQNELFRILAASTTWQPLFDRVALELNCLPSSFVDGNDHVFAAIEKLRAAAPQAGVTLTDEQIMRIVRYSTVGSNAIAPSEWCAFARALLTAEKVAGQEVEEEPDCWAILTPNGSRLVSPDEAKGRRDAYPLYRRATQQPAQPVAQTQALTDEQREAIKYARSVMGSVSWETSDSKHAKQVLDALLTAAQPESSLADGGERE